MRDELVAEIAGPLSRRFSTATVLFHHAVAERVGLGPTDHKCLDVLRDRGAMTGSELAGVTGLTTGAITGVVARLERTGRVCREADPMDRRKQLLHVVPEGLADLAAVFASMQDDAASLVEGFDTHQLAAVAEFLTRATDFAHRRSTLLRAESLSSGRRGRSTNTTEGGRSR